MTRYGLHSVPASNRISHRVVSRASIASVTPFPHTPDSALLAALREGHREFLRFAIRHTRSISAGEALVGDFYRQALETAATKEGEGLKTALIAALRSALAAYQCAASAAGPARVERPDVEEPLPLFLDDVERAVSGCLYRILPTLPSDAAWLIWQADLLGQPRDRLAKKLGIRLDHLGMRLARARRTTRAVLQRYRTTCPSHGFLNCTCEPSGEPEPEMLRATTPAATYAPATI
jgi:DNA-directed RNA polymerase specialized sigma24 family protein